MMKAFFTKTIKHTVCSAFIILSSCGQKADEKDLETDQTNMNDLQMEITSRLRDYENH